MAKNEDNLIGKGFDSRSTSEARELGRKGGIASGESRRRNRTLRELAQIISEKKVNMPMPDGTKEEMTYDAALVQSMYQKAVTRGDTKAAKFIATLLGEYTEKHEVEGKGAVIFLPKDEIEGIQELAKR